MSRHDRKGRLPAFVPLFKDTLASPAWRAMSHGARSLYVSLKARYNSGQHNNGRVFVSQRTASQEIGSSYAEIARWFRELQYYGFLVQTKGGSLGLNGKGTASPKVSSTEAVVIAQHERKLLSPTGDNSHTTVRFQVAITSCY
jgi:DNA-binding transcriptional MocR family regulator